MKRQPCIILTALLFAQVENYGQVIPVFEAEEWSGTATMVYTVRGKNFFSEIRHEAKISKGVGTATTSLNFHSETKERVETGQASGDGESSLFIGFGEDPPTYTISLPTPAAFGKMTVSIKGGGVETLPMGHDESSIMIPEQKLGSNPDILTGSYEIHSKEDENTTVQTFTWSFHRGTIDAEFLFGSLEYDVWQPRPGTDENTPGSKITVILAVVGKDGKPSRLKAKYFELELKNTSSEPGIALNAPLNPLANPQPDLKFLEMPNAVISKNGQSIKLSANDATDDLVRIGSFDGGGYTTLSGYAILENGIRIEGHAQPGGKINGMDIPKRSPGTRIAHSWVLKYGNLNESDDKERSIGNSNDGDGLTVYEEYRGIWSLGEWRRLDPLVKELMVGVDELPVFSDGMKVLAEAAGISVLPLAPGELTEDRCVNRNVSESVHKQYALRLVSGKLDSSIGVNLPVFRQRKSPKESERVIIDINRMKKDYEVRKKAWMEKNITIPFTLEYWIKSTVAHELAHGIGVEHHGPSSKEQERQIASDDSGTYTIFASAVTEIKQRPFHIGGKVGLPGGEASGDLNCMMADPLLYQWALRSSAGKFAYYEVPPLKMGIALCTSAKGTGINMSASNMETYFGNATDGNCLGKMKISDD